MINFGSKKIPWVRKVIRTRIDQIKEEISNLFPKNALATPQNKGVVLNYVYEELGKLEEGIRGERKTFK